MSRQFYGGAEAIDQLHHSSRSLPLSMSQSARDSPRTYPLSRTQNRSSPVPDSESEKGGNGSRKRIGLACARCRKRKIKCSGDQGQGICQNCKTAGMEPSSCLFLRVNSDVLSLNQSPAQLPWSYQHSGLPRSGGGVGPYSAMTAPASYAASSMTSTPFPNPMPYVRLPGGSQAGMSYHNGSRPQYATNYNSFPDDMTEVYGLSSPHYLSGQEPLPPVNYNSTEMSRAWASMPSTRQPHQSFHIDQEALTTPPLPPSSTLSSTGHSQFPAMGLLKSSLPNCGLNSRILPAPEPKGGSTSKNHPNTSILPSEGTGTSLQYRSSISWDNSHNGLQTHQHSVGSSTSSTVSAGSNSSSSPPMLQNPTTFAYRSTEQDREPDYNSSYNASSTAMAERQTGLDNGSFPDLPSDHIVPSQNQSPTQYTYNLGSSTKHPEGRLVNGQSYTRLLEPHHTQSYESTKHLTGPTTSYRQHRTSISSSRPH